LFSCIKRIVEVYQNIFRGRWGQEIDIEQDVPVEKGKEAPPVEDALRDAVGNIWKWSGFDLGKNVFQRELALLGTAGIQVVAEPGGRRPVRMNVVQAEHIRDIDMDDEDNVTAARIQYEVLEGPLGVPGDNGQGTLRKWATYEQVITKTETTTARNGKDAAVVPNQLGVCPFVLTKHQDVRETFGVGAVEHGCIVLDIINSLLSHCAVQTKMATYIQWLYMGPGEAPQSNLKFGDGYLMSVRTHPGDGGSSLEPLTPKLPLADAIKLIERLISELKNMFPELRLTDSEFLSNTSGETVAQLRVPGENLLRQAADQYEDGVERAIRICLSYGIMHGDFDLGTGKGSPESANPAAAQKAFDEGKMDFRFKDRDMTPRSRYEKAAIRKMESDARVSETVAATRIATLLSIEEAARTLGYADADISKFQDERSDEGGFYTAAAEAQARVLARGGGEILQEGQVKPSQVLKGIGGVTGAKRDKGV
jgi:hypothetical protein